MRNKILLPILLLATFALGACNKEGGESSQSEQTTSQDTTQYGVEITNKAALQEEWYAGANRDLEITLTPTGNPLKEITAKNLVITSSNEEVVLVSGLNLSALKEGTAKITVDYHGAKDEIDLTILDKKPAPQRVNKTPSEVMAADDTDGKLIYHVEGYVINWGSKTEWTQYGEMTVGDTADATEGMYVYGSYVEGVTFEWDGVEKFAIKYTNRDVLTNDLTKNLHIGDKVTMDVIRSDYGTTKEVKGQILAVEKGAFVEATGVEIQINGRAATELSLRANENKLLKSVIAPENASEDAVWSSSDPTVATVQDGFVKALKAGSTTIKAEVNANVKAELALTVTDALTVTHAGTQADPYTVEEAVAVVGGMDNNVLGEADIFVKGIVLTSSFNTTYKNYTIWLADSNDAKAFEIYAGVFADAAGVTDAQATEFQKANGLMGYEILASGRAKFYNNTLELTNYKPNPSENTYVYPQMLSVAKATATPTAVSAADLEVAIGGVAQIEPVFKPFYAEGELTYESGDTAIATVAADGKVTGVAAGTTKVTITYSETIKAEINVVVKDKDPLTEKVSLDFTNRTETNAELKSDDSNAANLANDTVLQFFQKAGEKGSHITSVSKISKVYSGTGTGGAIGSTAVAGCIKFGTSSASGELTLVLDGKANHVVINCESFNDNNTANVLDVTGADGRKLTPKYTADAKGGDLVFDLAKPTDAINIKSYVKYRVFIYSIEISYVAPAAAHTHEWGTAEPVTGADGKVSYTKQTCACGFVKLTIAAKDANAVLTGALSDTPEGTVKFSKAEDPTNATPTQGNASYTFNYQGTALKGKLYQVGYMDNWKTGNKNEGKSYIDSISVASSVTNFEVSVNNTLVKINKVPTFGDMPGNDGTDSPKSGWSPTLTCEIGDIELTSGDNTIVYARKGSYNLAYKELVIILEPAAQA